MRSAKTGHAPPARENQSAKFARATESVKTVMRAQYESRNAASASAKDAQGQANVAPAEDSRTRNVYRVQDMVALADQLQLNADGAVEWDRVPDLKDLRGYPLLSASHARAQAKYLSAF